MKRAGALYERIAEPENLRLAFWKARRGKDGSPDVEEFRLDLAARVEQLHRELMGERVIWGPYRRFTIHDPKERVISAAPFRDRVLHHAILNVCEPFFERHQIFDSYACRKGKGLHACLDRARRYTRRHRWHLKLDVRKYFDSISHNVLLGNLNRRFKDPRLLRLFSALIASGGVASGFGIPIGNLTSQFFANDYLAGLDHLIKEALLIPGYVRYMDDLVLWHDEQRILLDAERRIRDECRHGLLLELKPPVLNRTAHGVSMLGFRVLPGRILLARRSRKRFVRKLKDYHRRLAHGEWSQAEFANHALPLCSFAAAADSLGFRRKVVNDVGCRP